MDNLSMFGLSTSRRDATDEVLATHAFHSRMGCGMTREAALSEALEELNEKLEEAEKDKSNAVSDALDCGVSDSHREKGNTCKGDECAACAVWSEKQRVECPLSAKARDNGDPCKSGHDNDCWTCRFEALKREKRAESEAADATIAELETKLDSLANPDPDGDAARLASLERECAEEQARREEAIAEAEALRQDLDAARAETRAERQRAADLDAQLATQAEAIRVGQQQLTDAIAALKARPAVAPRRRPVASTVGQIPLEDYFPAAPPPPVEAQPTARARGSKRGPKAPRVAP